MYLIDKTYYNPPSAEVTSFTIAFRRSSNSPCFILRAFNRCAHIKRINLLGARVFGHVATYCTMRWARPSSAIAVLPVPNAPMSIGLFFCTPRRKNLPEHVVFLVASDNRSVALRTMVRHGAVKACMFSSTPWSVAFCPCAALR